MKDIFLMTMFTTGGFSSIIGAACLYLAGPFLLVLSVLKLVGALTINWFGYPAVLSVIGTPFWLVIFGLMILGVSMVVMFLATEAANEK